MSQSTFITTDTEDELSVHYTNLYILDGSIYYFSLENIKLPIVNVWTNAYGWHPILKVFKDETELNEFIKNNFTNSININNGIYGGVIWSHNIGHGLLDGLYPSYLSMVKFDKWNELFTFITNDWEYAEKNMTQKVIESFSGFPILEINKSKHNTYIINNLFAGTGRCGNRVVREDHTLYGSKYNGAERSCVQ